MSALETITSHRMHTSNRCGDCNRPVGVGVQCSLCHVWFHLAPDPEYLQEQQQHFMIREQEQNQLAGGHHHYGPSSSSSSAQQYQQQQQQQHFRRTSMSGSMSGLAAASSFHIQQQGRSPPHSSPMSPVFQSPITSGSGGTQTHIPTNSSSSFSSSTNQQQQQHLQAPHNNNNNHHPPLHPPAAVSMTSMHQPSMSLQSTQSLGFQASGAFSGVGGTGAATPLYDAFGKAVTGSVSCAGVDFPKYLPYFCEKCESRCALSDMKRITEIFGMLLQEEQDEISTGAPVLFAPISSSFVRKRIRAIGKGPFTCEKLYRQQQHEHYLSSLPNNGNNNNSSQQKKRKSDKNEQQQNAMMDDVDEQERLEQENRAEAYVDFFDEDRQRIVQTNWEKLFPRQTLQVLRRVLAVVYPEVYDDSALVAAAKAAKSASASLATSTSNNKNNPSLDTAASSSSYGASNSAFVASTSMAASSFNQPGGGHPISSLTEQQQEVVNQQQVNKFFAPVSFVAPNMTVPESSSLLTESDLHGTKKKMTAREQDVQMLEMQHEVTLHRLRWTPNQMGVSAQSKDVFGPQPVYVNPITSQIRLSDVRIEVGPDHRDS